MLDDGRVRVYDIPLESMAAFRRALVAALESAEAEALRLAEVWERERTDRVAAEAVLNGWQLPEWILAARWSGIRLTTLSLTIRASAIRVEHWSALLDSPSPYVQVTKASNELVIEGAVGDVVAALESAYPAIDVAIREANSEADGQARADAAFRAQQEADVNRAFWESAT